MTNKSIDNKHPLVIGTLIAAIANLLMVYQSNLGLPWLFYLQHAGTGVVLLLFCFILYKRGAKMSASILLVFILIGVFATVHSYLTR